MLNWLRNLARRPLRPGLNAPRFLRGRYDAAVNSPNNRRHWVNADGLSAGASNSREVRRVLRNRARYEVANNSYAKGIVLTLANDVIGTGPRLQLLTSDADVNRLIEQEFLRWAQAIGLAEKLRTMRMAEVTDGEAFAILVNNDTLNTAVQLDLRIVEADQVTTPEPWLTSDANAVDGIVFDDHGNAIEYHVLKGHPGNLAGPLTPDYDRIPASSVIHLFRTDRPGQQRGVPEITPALPLFAMLRYYSLATLDAAKAAACFAGILYTDAPANGEADAVEPLDEIELDRNLLLTMPGGWKMSQLKSEHPSGTYSEFKREILNEIARCLNMPFNVAAANSSGYNYASGRLDHQTYFKAIRVDQSHIESCVLNRILTAWLDEAMLVPGLIPDGSGPYSEWSHTFFFDGHEHIDPAKEARAQAMRLASHTTTLADEYARRGLDWETQLRQRADEKRLMKDLGLTTDESPQESEPQDTTDEKQSPTAA